MKCRCPDAPKGERPKTTIRWQRRQMEQMERTIEATKGWVLDRDKTIADLREHVEQVERDTQAAYDEAIEQRRKCLDLSDRMKTNMTRLAFLEGYYARSQETEGRHPPGAHGGTGQRNQGDLPAGEKDHAQARPQANSARYSDRSGGPPWSIGGDNIGGSPEEALSGYQVGEAEDGPERYRR